MDFYTSRRIADNELLAWLDAIFPTGVFVVNGEPTSKEYVATSEPWPTGDFPWHITVFLPSRDVAEEVKRIAEFARATGCDALCSDERTNPYSWIQITSSGELLSVFVDAEALDGQNAFVIHGPADHPDGGLWSARAMDQEKLALAVSEILSANVDNVQITTAIEPQFPATSPYDSWHPIVDGQHYRFGYFVSVVREQRKWQSMAEEAQNWQAVVASISSRFDIPLCARAEAYSLILNIPGGSDSHEYCIWIAGTQRRQITTKRARRHW